MLRRSRAGPWPQRRADPPEPGRPAMLGAALVRVTAVIVGILLLGCSSQTLPPNLTCDSGCGVAAGAGIGSGPSNVADAGVCAPSPNDTACTQCAKASCCAEVVNCSAVECDALSSCEAVCNSSSCVATCEQQFTSSVAPLNEFTSCVSTNCPTCTELGVGDPCEGAQGSCQAGLTCNGQWCSEPCSSSAQCAGLGAGGANSLGEQNACVGTATSGNVCFPGCANSPTDCAPFSGTACLAPMSVEGVTVAVCESVPDAGAD
jgi:hypothetical protein